MENSKIAGVVHILFFLAAILNLISQIIDSQLLEYISKPLLMILLALYYLMARKEKIDSIDRFLILALAFSWGGDMLLMLQGHMASLFLFGLGSFLVAHVFYILVYQKAKIQDASEGNSFQLTRMVFLLFIGGAILYMLIPRLGELLIPVIAYTGVIITMAIFALLRKGRTSEQSFIMVYSGALLFIMSDAMIAFDKFLDPIPYSRILIMATYMAAQYLIVKGILTHQNEPTES